MQRESVLVAVVAAALAIVAVGVYWDAHDNEFVWDDPIVFERQLPYFDSLSNVFMPPPQIPQFGTHYYRPLIVMSYQLDEAVAASLWPEEERDTARRYVYHGSVLVYHALATVLVLLLGLALQEASGARGRGALAVAGAAGLLFAVHPIHVESVAWMAGRSDVICGIFFFAAAIGLVRYAREPRGVWLILTLAASFAAMMSKETGVGLALLAPVVLLTVSERERAIPAAASRAERRRLSRQARPRGGRRLPRALAPVLIAVVTVIYLGIRRAALTNMGSPSFDNLLEHTGTGTGAKLLRLLQALGFYAWKTIWPPPQSAFVKQLPDAWPWAVLGAIVLVAVVTALWRGRRLRRAVREDGSAGREVLAVALWITGLAPSLAIAALAISETPLAERYLYIPSAGAVLLLAFLVARAAARLTAAPPAAAPAAAVIVALALSIPAGVATVRRVDVWATDLAFWTDTVAKSPETGLPYLHLGIRLTHLDRIDEALAAYDRAYERYDDAEGRSKALNNAGSLYLRTGRYEEAIEKFKQALQEVSGYPTAHYNWALAEIRLARNAPAPRQREHLRAAEQHLQVATRLNPRYTKALYQYGRLLAATGRRGEARRYLERAVRAAPTSPEGREARQVLERMRGD